MFRTSGGYQFWGLYTKFFEKFEFRKKNFIKTEAKIMKNPFFEQKFIKNCVFYVKFKFGMFSAFIWYTYCPSGSKMMKFEKYTYRKLADFRGQTRLLRRSLAKKLYSIGQCSKTLEIAKDVSFHLRPCIDDLYQK